MSKLLKKFFVFAVGAFVLASCNVSCAVESSPFVFTQKDSVTSKTPVITNAQTAKDFQNRTIRVLLSNKGSFDNKEITFSSDDEIFVAAGNNFVASSSSPIKISVDGDYFIITTQGDMKKVLINEKLLLSTNDKPIKIANSIKSGIPASYKGNIEVFLHKNGKIRAINIVDIEDYIKGVVPNEMPVYFGLEALKAQAISARGYAYRDASYKTTGYDVCDTTGSQVYYGAGSYDAISNRAVDETLGQFALYDGKVILSLYSSTAGGHTESYENVFSLNGIDTRFPADPIPYLTGVPDYDYDADLSKERDARRFYENKPEAFDMNSPKYRWEYSWTKEELTEVLTKNLMKFSSSKFVQPSLKDAADFGEIKEIDVPRRGVSGKAMYVRITTDKATFLMAKEITIRQIFTKNNKWLPSANIVFEEIKDGRKVVGYKVIGGGFGHGVGLSQYGAAGMAKKGYKYDDILQHYYQGISIGSYPVECKLKDLKNCKATFFFPNKSANLIITYPYKPGDLAFKINNSDVIITSDSLGKKSAEFDIKKWLKKGVNTIELVNAQTSALDLTSPTIKFYVELVGKNEK